MNLGANKILSQQRSQEIYSLLHRINIKQQQIKTIRSNESKFLHIINEALTHTSSNLKINHEKLEFLGDAVLRLAASEYIDSKYPKLKVGDRSALRAQIVSDQWLSHVGERIGIQNAMLIGVNAFNDQAAKSTMQAEATEALIGALYECFRDIDVVKDWLKQYWDEESESILNDPHKKNSKSALQEWSQGKGMKKPIYITTELSKVHGDAKRFSSKVIIEKKVFGEGWGSSRKKAEKEAALIALTNLKDI